MIKNSPTTLQRAWQLHSKHLSLLVSITVISWIIITRFAWMIIEQITGQNMFPGFTSPDVLSNILVNCAATLGTGLLMILPAFLFPSFRKNPIELLHIPVAFGVVLFLLFFSFQVYIGLKI